MLSKYKQMRKNLKNLRLMEEIAVMRIKRELNGSKFSGPKTKVVTIKSEKIFAKEK